MSSKQTLSKPIISVFIPVYNGEIYLHECIESILHQELPGDYELELIITDSGSSDRSIEIIRSFGDAVVFDEIPNIEYGHGKTRQRAAKKARGEYILFLSQDATPSHSRWLIDMIEPFFISEKIGVVFGRQIPRPFSVPTIKREVSSVFNSFGASNTIVIHNRLSLVDNSIHSDYNYFLSDVNSAVRRDLLVSSVPFRDVKYAEDMALAEDMSTAGYLKAYSPRGSVWHSNEYTAPEYYHRKFDEYLGLISNGDHIVQTSLKELWLGWIKPTIADWGFIRNDTEYNKRAKIKFFFTAALFNINEKRAKSDAIRYHSSPSEISRRSLEEKRKKS